MTRGIDVGLARTRLATALKTATGIKAAWPFIPDRLAEIPCAFVGPPSITYNETFGRQGRTALVLPVTLVVGRLSDADSQGRLDAFISNADIDGVTVKAAIEAIEGYALVLVTEAHNAGQADHAGTTYLAVDLNVQIVS